MATKGSPRGEDFVTPGMAYKKAFGTVDVPSVVVGYDDAGKPRYQAGEVVVTAATPRQGLRELDRQELAADGRDTRDVVLGVLGSMLGGGVVNKLAGRPVIPGVAGEAPSPLGASTAMHELIRRYLSNEDLGTHDILASRDLMPNVDNPYDDDPAARANGVFVDPGQGRRTYFPPSPPTYRDRRDGGD
jgi:hypothetical protein